MKQPSGFISTIKLGQYDVVNTPSSAELTDAKLEPVITNVSGTGPSRTVTTQITNTGNSDVHNAWVKVEVFSQGSRVKLDGQDYLRVDIGTVKPRQHDKINFQASAFLERRLSSMEKCCAKQPDCAEHRHHAELQSVGTDCGYIKRQCHDKACPVRHEVIGMKAVRNVRRSALLKGTIE